MFSTLFTVAASLIRTCWPPEWVDLSFDGEG